MAVLLSPVGGVAAQFFTNAGVPLSGGKIYTYAAGTTTPQATYTTALGNIQHSNPIVLDAAGRIPTGEIWLTDGLSYKFVLKDLNDVLIATYDNIVGINSNFVNYVNQQEIQTATAGQTVFNLTTMEYQPGTGNLSVFVDGVNQYGPGAQYAFTETDSNTVTFVSGLHVGASVKFTSTQIQNSGIGDASQITYTYPAVDAVEESVEERLAQYVSVKDFGAVGDGVTDDTVAMQAAHDTGRVIYYPEGIYKFTSITINAGGIYGDGPTLTNLNCVDSSSTPAIKYTGEYVQIAGGLTEGTPYFANFTLNNNSLKTTGAALSFDPASGNCEYVYVSNVTITYFPVGIDFVAASFFKVVNCTFGAYTISGIQVANKSNNDAGDSSIIGCVFNCPYNSVLLPSGIRHFSSGGLKVIGNKFLGGNFGYRLEYTDSDGTGANTSIAILNGNSIENFYSNAISLTKTSASLTGFPNVIISNNEIAVALATPTAFLIASDNVGSWLQSVAITGNTFQLPGVTNSYGIGLEGVTCLNISGNTFRGNGGTSTAITLTSCSDVKIGTNVYSNITVPYELITPASNNSVVLESQSGSATTASSGWSAYYGTGLYISPVTTITFATPFLKTPNVSDIQFTLASGDGSLNVVVNTISKTQATFAVVASRTNFAATIYWQTFGTL